MEWICHLNEIGQVAADFWASQHNHRVFAFHGEMGAGKTSFIHALCDARGVKDVVGSPSFSLVNEYAIAGEPGTIYHMDLYRIRDEEEASRAGIEDCLYSGSICLVEWPERIPGLLPPETVHVYMDWIDNDSRRIKIADN
ncbi:MAG: tRNA (adenosine(37)-N6)-threonylcarbamoyltransferase complex ATPase subunit type 1 TsaE [Chitinophagaceae bacterium]|nr:tRNA (adenosine(37)-N6)-threonylcarbamoyltransferase complex ATPase subunit type 1 TsaE [Chitinophagaceae bacterium]